MGNLRKLIFGLLFTVGALLLVTATVAFVDLAVTGQGDIINTLIVIHPFLIASALLLWLAFFIRKRTARKATDGPQGAS
jgi:hypothetical protein